MDFDHSWQALLRPGDGDGFFTIRSRPVFDPQATAFSPANAWWLAEMSRLIYRREAEPGELGFLSRVTILEDLYIREIAFCSTKNAQWSLNRVEGPQPFVVLVFRGTSGFVNWLANLRVFQSPWEKGGQVHSGFKTIFMEIRYEIAAALEQINEPVIITGHSLGGALAVLAAATWPPKATYTFGSPRVGDTLFRESLRGQAIFRIAADKDIITSVPPSRIPFEFCHVGETFRLRLPESESAAGSSRAVEIPIRTGAATLPENFRLLSNPPRFLSEHAPINYSVALANLLERRLFIAT